MQLVGLFVGNVRGLLGFQSVLGSLQFCGEIYGCVLIEIFYERTWDFMEEFWELLFTSFHNHKRRYVDIKYRRRSSYGNKTHLSRLFVSTSSKYCNIRSKLDLDSPSQIFCNANDFHSKERIFHFIKIHSIAPQFQHILP